MEMLFPALIKRKGKKETEKMSDGKQKDFYHCKYSHNIVDGSQVIYAHTMLMRMTGGPEFSNQLSLCEVWIEAHLLFPYHMKHQNWYVEWVILGRSLRGGT